MASLTLRDILPGARALAEYAPVDTTLDAGPGLVAAAASFGGGPGVILVSRPHRVRSNTTLPANISLMLLPGATITVDAAMTLTVAGTVQAADTLAVSFPGAGTTTISGRLAVAGGAVMISGANPAAVATAPAPGAAGLAADAGHVHTLGGGVATGAALGADVIRNGGAAGGALAGTWPNPTLAVPTALQKIGEIIVGGVVSAAIDFTAIPQTFRHLILELAARSDSAGTTVEGVFMQVSGDTGPNYDRETMEAGGVGVTATENYGNAALSFGYANGGASPAGLQAISTVRLLNYANTAYNKAMICQSAGKHGIVAGSMRSSHFTGFWRNNAAITSLHLTGGGNFAIGTVATLYGEY